MNRVAVPLELSPPAERPRGGAMIELGGPTMGVAWSVKALAPANLNLAAVQDGLQAHQCPGGVACELVYSGGKPEWGIGQMGLFLQAAVKVG